MREFKKSGNICITVKRKFPGKTDCYYCEKLIKRKNISCGLYNSWVKSRRYKWFAVNEKNKNITKWLRC